MIFPLPTQHAIHALSELVIKMEDAAPGHRPADCRFGLTQLLEDTPLPRTVLAKIFSGLVRAGLLRGRKGPGGGFGLSRPADQITLLEIMEGVSPRNKVDGCLVGLAECHGAALCPVHDSFEPTRQVLRSYLATTTLADVAASLRAKRTARVRNAVPRGRRRTRSRR